MSIPLSLLLIPYGLFLVFFAIMNLVYLYHLLRYGAASFGTYIFLGLYALMVIGVAGVSLQYIGMLEFSTTVELFPRTL